MPREAETSTRHAVLLPQPVCLPFCVASLRRSKEDLAPWEAGVELSLAEGTALQALGGTLSSFPFALQKPSSCQAGSVPGREALAPLSGVGMKVPGCVWEQLPVPASCQPPFPQALAFPLL